MKKAHGVSARERKNMDMDAGKLARARAILGARSDTEAVDLALDLVAFHDDVASALDRLTRAGGLTEAYPRAGGNVPGSRKVAKP